VIIRGQEITWASGSLATGAVFNVMALFGLFYLSTILGIEAGVAGLLLFIVRIYDAITDPLMGTISDRTRHRWGARRPYLLLGSLTLGVAFALFFNLPTLNGAAMIAVVLATLILYSTSYTIFAVPYLAMSPDIAPDYDSRTRLMSMRVFFLIVGVLLGSTGGPMLVQAAGDGRRGYAVLGFAIGALVIVGGLVAFFGTRGVKERDSATQLTERRPLLVEAKALYSQVRSVFRFAPFRLLTVVKLLQLAVLALALACTPYFFRFVLERSTGDITYYFATFSLCGLASLVGWRWIIGRWGKRDVYIYSIALYAIGMASWFLWHPEEAEIFFYLRAAFIGVIANGTLVCALSLLPDTMEYDRLASGADRQGVMSGVFTTVEKIAGALGPLIIGVMLQTMGLDSTAAPAEQPASALFAVKLGISLIPALFCLAAIPFLLAYKLGPKELQQARQDAQ
jgi:sugar (glycoside-pentoside-hexuronide) transporter